MSKNVISRIWNRPRLAVDSPVVSISKLYATLFTRFSKNLTFDWRFVIDAPVVSNWSPCTASFSRFTNLDLQDLPARLGRWPHHQNVAWWRGRVERCYIRTSQVTMLAAAIKAFPPTLHLFSKYIKQLLMLKDGFAVQMSINLLLM